MQISSFLSDYDNALARAQAFDSKISSDASRISSDYASVVALSVRQGFGAIEFTVSKTSDGQFNASDIMVFMKGIDTDVLVQLFIIELFVQRSRATGCVFDAVLSVKSIHVPRRT